MVVKPPLQLLFPMHWLDKNVCDPTNVQCPVSQQRIITKSDIWSCENTHWSLMFCVGGCAKSTMKQFCFPSKLFVNLAIEFKGWTVFCVDWFVAQLVTFLELLLQYMKVWENLKNVWNHFAYSSCFSESIILLFSRTSLVYRTP